MTVAKREGDDGGKYHSHAPRGNASMDAPRPVPQERHKPRSHAGAWER